MRTVSSTLYGQLTGSADAARQGEHAQMAGTCSTSSMMTLPRLSPDVCPVLGRPRVSLLPSTWPSTNFALVIVCIYSGVV